MRIQIEVSDLPGVEDFIVSKNYIFTHSRRRYPHVDRLEVIGNLAEVISGVFDAICGGLGVSWTDRNRLACMLTGRIQSNVCAVTFEPTPMEVTNEPS